MAQVTESAITEWTAADLVARFGAVSLSRIRLGFDPGAEPRTAGEEDVIEIHDREKRLYELIDGVLLEKAMGTYESFLAGLLVRWIGNFVAEQDSGIVLPPDGMLRLSPGLVRIPDVSFISRGRLPGGKVPRDPIADLVPDLAVEVVSKSNTTEEMQQKLEDYLTAGVRLVWYVYPLTRSVRVYTAIDQETTVGEGESLAGGDVLPGFTLPVSQIFAE